MNPLDVRVPPGHIESDSNQKLDDEVDVLPTTLAQRRFLDYDRTHPGNPAYNIAIRIQLEGKFEPAVMERAANELVRRHEMLRTFFSDVDGEPVQVVLPNLKVSLTIVDLREVPEDDRPAKVDGLSKAEARTRFDLSHVPLLRFKLLRLSDSHHILLMTIHQTVSDCWSVGILSHELGVLYAAYKRGEESPLPELPLQYGDYAVWQKKWIENHGLGNQLDFWKSQLVDLPVLEVPTDRPRPSIASNNGDIFSVLLPKSLTEPLKELSHRQGCTFFMLSLAAINVLLQRLTGRTDIPVGTITAGRTRVEMEPLIGRFINPLVIRTDLSGDPLFLDLLAQVMNRVIDALENRDIPYECVVQAIKPATDPTRHPVFQINFVHQRAFVRPLNMSGLSFSGIPSVSAGAIYDLYFFMVERPEGWRLSCEYNTDLYERESVRKMIDHYRAILEGIATDAARPISALPWATSASPSSNPQLLITRQDETKPVVKRSFIAPKNETETKLELLWRKVIRAERVSVDSDFFDEGGHSVLAARLLYMVHKEFGVQLSFGAFLKAPTIAKLAERLQQGEEVWTDRILVFRNGRPKPPLIIIDPFHRYHDVASYFGPDFSVIGLSSPPVRD
ncbi:MAG TPA: condensation domain-containing protein, partial [Fimbriiglobus sp.]